MGFFDWIKNIGKKVKDDFDGLVEEGKAIENEPDGRTFMDKKDIPKWEPLAPKAAQIVNPVPSAPDPLINQEVKEKYNLIVSKIKLRQEQVDKLDKNDPNLIPLVHELDNYKKKATELKKQLYIKK